MKKQSIFLTVILLTLLFCSCSNNKNGDKQREGWQLAWEENFSSGKLDTQYWNTITPSNKIFNRYMSNEPSLYVFQNKKVVLRSLTSLGQDDQKLFKTAGITTKGKKLFRNGRIEVRAKLNPTTGATAFIKLFPADESENIRINLMEQYSTDKFVYHSLSSNYTEESGMSNTPPSNVIVSADPIDYHTYSVELTADSVLFFIDKTRTKAYPRIQPEIEGQFPFYDRDFFLSIGVSIYREEEATEKPIDMFIDWVRYYIPNEKKAS